jgi:diaminopropionate ammonia-lyase
MRFVFNPFLRADAAGAASPDETAAQARGAFAPPHQAAGTSRQAVLQFHRSLPGYAPTPLHACPGLARSLGLAHLHVKDESRRFGLKAFKGLGASWALHRLLEDRRAAGAPPPRAVATATDGNHGRALAWAARREGIEAIVFIPAGSAAARIEAIRGEGARVVPVEGTYDDAVRRCAEESAENGWQVIADTGYEGYLDIPRLVAEGYSTLFAEAEEQIEVQHLERPGLVIVQGGVGALASAAVDHYRRHHPRPIIAVVEPVDADCLLESIASPDGRPRPARGRQASIMAGLNCGTASLAAWPVLRDGVDLFLSIEDRFAEEAMRRFHRPAAGDPPIEAGESGAAGLAGLIALAADPAFRAARERLALSARTAALVINTEGATDPVSFRRIVGADPG